MLVFSNNEHVKNALKILDDEYLSKDAQFVSEHAELTIDQLNDLEEQIGYDHDKVYKDFESKFKGFVSLRKSIENQKNSLPYLSGLISEIKGDYVIEESVRTILNQYGEVQIGNDIIKMFNSGYIRIIGGNRTVLNSLRNNINNALTSTGVQIEGNLLSTSEDCVGHSLTREKVVGNNNIRIRCVSGIQTFPWDRYVIAKTEGEEKRKRLGWKNIRAGLIARIWGDVAAITYDDGGKANGYDCDTPLTFNLEDGLKEEDNNVKRIKHKISVQTKTKSGWCNGYHQLGNNISGIVGKTAI